ncbi:MAG TPA: heme exporter protein CcmD [Stellaceae bacterium]|jgi:heme exporter protein D
MSTVSDFLAMGGYAAFVWPAYGVAAIVLGGITVQSVLGYRARRRELDRLQAASGGERRRRQ